MTVLFCQVLGYGFASACALAVDFLILHALVEGLAWNPVLAAAASFMAGATVAYLLAIRLAFREHRLKSRRAEFVSFVLLGVVGLIVNEIVISVAVKFFAFHYLVAKSIAAGFTFFVNFAIRRQILFVDRG